MSRLLRVMVCFRVQIPDNIGDQDVEDIYIQVDSASVGSYNDVPIGAEILSYYTRRVEEVNLQ